MTEILVDDARLKRAALRLSSVTTDEQRPDGAGKRRRVRCGRTLAPTSRWRARLTVRSHDFVATETGQRNESRSEQILLRSVRWNRLRARRLRHSCIQRHHRRADLPREE